MIYLCSIWGRLWLPFSMSKASIWIVSMVREDWPSSESKHIQPCQLSLTFWHHQYLCKKIVFDSRSADVQWNWFLYNHIRCFSHCLEQCVILWNISQKIHRTFRTDFVIMRLFCCKDHKMIYNNNKIKKLSPGLRWKETQVSFIFNLISFIL